MQRYFGVPSYKNGLIKNKNPLTGVDESVWFENDKLDKRFNHNDLRVWLYLLEDIKNENIFKIGISAYTFKRINQVNFASRGKHEFILVDHKFIGCRQKAYSIEQAILNVLKEYRVYKKAIFDGASEILNIEKDKISKCYFIKKFIDYYCTHSRAGTLKRHTALA